MALFFAGAQASEADRGKAAPTLLFGAAHGSTNKTDGLSASPGPGQIVERPKRGSVYIKYVRVGEINLTVHLLGFAKPLNLKGYQASVPPFVKQRKIGPWVRLAVKAEKHLAFSLVKSKLPVRGGIEDDDTNPADRNSNATKTVVEGSTPPVDARSKKTSLLFGIKR